jgi:hypothetical protein
MQAHLAGERTLALSSTDAEGCCRWLCLDLDRPSGLQRLRVLRAALAARGLPGLLEASRRGGHLWLFLEAPLPAREVRAGVLAALDDHVTQGGVGVLVTLELYPSAANLTPGTLGQAVRLPCGFTRLERAMRFVLAHPACPQKRSPPGWPVAARARPVPPPARHRPRQWLPTTRGTVCWLPG